MESKTNKLIAAAPRLLAACKEVHAELSDRYDVDQPLGEPAKEYPFSGVGRLLVLLGDAIKLAEEG